MLARLKKIEIDEEKSLSKLTLSIDEVFKGPNPPSHGDIVVNFHKNLDACTCKGLEPHPHLLVMTGKIMDGLLFIDESSYVRFSHHLLRHKVRLLAKTQHMKCEGKKPS